MNNIDLLKTALKAHGFHLSEEKIKNLAHFMELLVQWNQVFNLTQIERPRDIVYLHIIDSLLSMPFVKGQHCLDVGSGGGLPGIPLAIIFPDQQWTLVDKNNKKTRFLTQVVAQLSLSNVTVLHQRVEDFQLLSRFDTILSRAFGSLFKMIESTRHLLQREGCWIAMKGKYPTEELAMLPNTVIYQVNELKMIGMDITRHLVRIKLRM